jgi:two-component system nitrate/nitrite response regulator NarL
MVRILIVDDKPDIRKMIREFLEAESDLMVCGEGADGQQAVDRAASLQPHVIVLDVSMPVMNGFDAARQILQASPRVLILILSLHDDRQYTLGAKDCGAHGFLAKRDAAEFLRPAISALLRGELYFPGIAAK